MSTSTRGDEPYTTCICGRVFHLREVFCMLPLRGLRDLVDGSLTEERQCDRCGGSIVVFLVQPITVDDMRRAVKLIDRMNESFNMTYSAGELLRLLKVCWAGGWDCLPDEWTGQQCFDAINTGAVPEFEERNHGLHALNVSDCRCLDCLKRKT